MTTSANDETKKDAPLPNSGTASGSDDTGPSVAPKKRKRKRKPKKPVAVSPVTEKKEKPEEKTHKETPHKETKKESDAEKKPTPPKGKNEEKEEKPNLDIKSDEHMLPGIDNIHDYIARKKAAPSTGTEKKDMSKELIAADGTELLHISGLYAVVPHAKGDHKLVYLTKDMPEGLLDDPRKRQPGSMYVKNGHDIYMVHVTMKEHPSLKNAQGESYDVWLIDDPQELTQQVKAIKQGKGGGENFSIPVLASVAVSAPLETETIPELPKQQEEEIQVTKDSESIDPEEPTTEETTPEQEPILEADKKSQTAKEIETVSEPLTGLDELTQNPEEAIEGIDLTLPDDIEILEKEPDIDSTLPDSSDSPKLDSSEEIESHGEEISLDGMEDFTLSKEDTEDLAGVNTETEETIEEEKLEEASEQSKHHFGLPTNDTGSSLPDLGIEEESEGHPLFGSEREATSEKESTEDEPVVVEEQASMFHEPIVSPADKISPDAAEEHHEEISTEPMFSVHHKKADETQDAPSSEISSEVPSETPSVNEHNETGTSSKTALEDEGDTNMIDLDTLSIDTTSGGIDLDTMATSMTDSSTSSPIAKDTGTKKKSFPFAIVMRIVLFLVIIGALILVWKVMFPAIKGAKPTEETPPTTGQVIDEPDNEIITPPTDIDPVEEIPPFPPVEETPPSGGVTLNELTEKLKIQQTEARKLLNMAKLLENKDAIKFSLAGMLKAGNVLERIATESTITAEDVQKEAEKVDAYLMEASKLIE